MPKSPDMVRTRPRRAPTRTAFALASAAVLSPVVLAPGSHVQTAQSGHKITLDEGGNQAPRGANYTMLGSNVVALTNFVESAAQPHDAARAIVATDPKPRPAPKPETYTVREGDSPWSISEHFDPHAANPKDLIIFLDKFLRDNHLNPAWTPIYEGQIVRIPTATEAAAPNVPLTPPEPVATLNYAPQNTSHAVYHANYANSTPVAQPTYTANAGNSSFEACVIQRESGGNSNARNGQFWGTYQFGPTAWAEAGGNPADFGTASAAEQQQVFHQAEAKGMGYSGWGEWDGC